MQSDGTATSVIDAGPLKIVQRNPATLSSHRFLDSRTPGFVREAIDFRLTGAVADGGLTVSATIANRRVGHHFPAGSPMRHMILVLDALDAEGRPLVLAAGERVPEWGGSEPGPVEPLAGRPGKGFAKILKDRAGYSDRPEANHLDPLFPAPHWRPATIVEDNRLAFASADVSNYRFILNSSAAWPVTVTARLIIRRTFQAWALAQGLTDIESEIARDSILLDR